MIGLIHDTVSSKQDGGGLYQDQLRTGSSH
jgi:hypothetical protein